MSKYVDKIEALKYAIVGAISEKMTWGKVVREIDKLPTIEVSEDMGEVSDGYHTFNQLYHQRAVLFATIVNQNKGKAWKSWRHEDGEFCFDKGGEWFIVGIDTPEGSYTYHYEQAYWDMFNCEELDRGKHWDGHTEEDVTRLLSLPPIIPTVSENCDNCIWNTCNYNEVPWEVSEDCISREWVLEEFQKGKEKIYLHKSEYFDELMWLVKLAPSVVPSRTGKPDFADCEKCSKTEGSLGCCSTVNNKWVYSCLEGMIDFAAKQARAEGEWKRHPIPENRAWDICTACGIGCRRRHYGFNEDGTEWVEEANYPFCPNCGARMRG